MVLSNCFDTFLYQILGQRRLCPGAGRGAGLPLFLFVLTTVSAIMQFDFKSLVLFCIYMVDTIERNSYQCRIELFCCRDNEHVKIDDVHC